MEILQGRTWILKTIKEIAMALTSEEVVQQGVQVVEHVNKLSEQMVVYQQRLDNLTGMFDDMSEKMDQREQELNQTFDTIENTLRENCLQQSVEIGTQIEGTIKTPCLERLSGLKDELSNEFLAVNNSNISVVDRWSQWRDSDLTELRDQTDEQLNQQLEGLRSLNDRCNEDIELMDSTANEFIDQSGIRLEGLNDYLQEATNAVTEAQQNYQQEMLDAFSSKLDELLSTTFQNLTDTQRDLTETTLNDTTDQFANMIKSELIPLIDQLVQEVSDAIDEMTEKVVNIGDDANEKSRALDAVTSMLEQLIQPIKETIDRTQSIKNVVDGFL